MLGGPGAKEELLPLTVLMALNSLFMCTDCSVTQEHNIQQMNKAVVHWTLTSTSSIRRLEIDLVLLSDTVEVHYVYV